MYAFCNCVDFDKFPLYALNALFNFVNVLTDCEEFTNNPCRLNAPFYYKQQRLLLVMILNDFLWKSESY